MNAVAVVFTLFRQAKELCMQQNAIRTMNADVVVHCNNALLLSEIERAMHGYNASRTTLVWTGKNAGFRDGPIDAISTLLPVLQTMQYECVAHLHADVFIYNATLFATTLAVFCTSGHAFGGFCLVLFNVHPDIFDV